MQTTEMRDDRRTKSEQSDEPPAVKSPVEARAGLISGHVITVLVLGMVLAIILLAGAFIFYFA